MSNYTFAQRYRKDQRFRAAVEDVTMEALLRVAGVDPETLREAYESGVRPLTLDTYEEFAHAPPPAPESAGEPVEIEGLPDGLTATRSGSMYTIFDGDNEVAKERGQSAALAAALVYAEE